MSSSLPVTVGVARDADGELYVPAQHVTDLLRSLAGHWQTWAEEGEPGFAPPTVDLLARQLREIADQIDVECIARTHPAATGDRQGGEPA